MGFNLYRHQTTANLRESYSQPERLVLSGVHGPLAIYVQSVYKKQTSAEWDLSEVELAALLRPGQDITQAAILFEVGSELENHVTIHRVISIHGRSTAAETEIIVHFKSLYSNLLVPDSAKFRLAFEADPVADKSDIYENLKLSGGTQTGTWKWMESEQILNASVISPKHP
jgi:hypothetical protein